MLAPMLTTAEAVPIEGRCDDRFAEVMEEFRRNLAERGDLGASVAITVGGEPVVDLWGGFADADRTAPWQQDTIAVVMSCTKGATALCAHLLAATGELDFDAPVMRYWPEFAQAGKEGVLVRHLLSHQAGLPAVRTPLEPGAFYDAERMAAVLAAEAPFWEPGTAYGYHGLTYGFLVGEIVRRITGTGIGAFFRSEVAEPLGIDLAIGLPSSEHGRVSHLNPAPPPAPGDSVPPFLVKAMTDPTSVQALMIGNTGGYFVPEAWDSPEALQAVIPASGGVGNARSLAAMYAPLATDGRVGRVTFSTADIARMGSVQSAIGADQVLLGPGRWALGFMKGVVSPAGYDPPARIVLSEDAFGHLGHGGSIGFADPVAGMSFAYVMNQMAPDMGLSATGQSLVDAAYRALGYEPGHGMWTAHPTPTR
jgi:CubicO group peptidase (beta-lactamase class C family)